MDKLNIIKKNECALCSGKTNPGMPNYHQYTLIFIDKTTVDIGLCDKCLPKMVDRKNREIILKKLKNTSYMTWGEKKLK